MLCITTQQYVAMAMRRRREFLVSESCRLRRLYPVLCGALESKEQLVGWLDGLLYQASERSVTRAQHVQMFLELALLRRCDTSCSEAQLDVIEGCLGGDKSFTAFGVERAFRRVMLMRQTVDLGKPKR
jgi:hypothetical protein